MKAFFSFRTMNIVRKFGNFWTVSCLIEIFCRMVICFVKITLLNIMSIAQCVGVSSKPFEGWQNECRVHGQSMLPSMLYVVMLAKFCRFQVDSGQDAAPSHTVAYGRPILRRENVALIQPDMWPQKPGFKFGGYCWCSWNRRSCWMTRAITAFHGSRTVSVNGDVVCSVTRIRIADACGHVSILSVCTTKSLLQTLCWNIIGSTTFVVKYQHASHVAFYCACFKVKFASH